MTEKVALERRAIKLTIVTPPFSTLSSFYKYALKQEIVEGDPVHLADKPQ